MTLLRYIVADVKYRARNTTIACNLPQDSEVVVKIYGILDREIAALIDSYQRAGHNSVVWDGVSDKGNGISSGVYYYSFSVNSKISYKKMLLLK